MIDTSQPAMIGAAAAIYVRSDDIGGGRVVVYYCKESSLEVHPFRLDGRPYTTAEITSLGLTGTQSSEAVVNGDVSTDTLYVAVRRGAYSLTKDLRSAAGEALLLGTPPDVVLKLVLATVNGIPATVVSTNVIGGALAVSQPAV